MSRIFSSSTDGTSGRGYSGRGWGVATYLALHCHLEQSCDLGHVEYVDTRNGDLLAKGLADELRRRHAVGKLKARGEDLMAEEGGKERLAFRGAKIRRCN